MYVCMYIYHDIENSSFYNMYKSSVSPSVAKQIMRILFALCYNGGRKLTAAKIKLMFSVSGFALLYVANMSFSLVWLSNSGLELSCHNMKTQLTKIEFHRNLGCSTSSDSSAIRCYLLILVPFCNTSSNSLE
jgi:hypothetical protein